MADQTVQFSSGLPSTVLPDVETSVRARLDAARAEAGDERRDLVAGVVADHPRCSEAWADLAELARDRIERYAAHRVGYHRGLDALRANGWRGSGYVRWSEPGNRGFLRCLLGLAHDAAEIGESDEAERCQLFLVQLDPSGIPEESAR